MKNVKNRMSLFSTKIFVILLVALILPTVFMFQGMNQRFETEIQQELSEKIIQNISQSEDAIYQTFQGMANMSTTIVLDEELVNAFTNNGSYYDRTVAFDNTLAVLLANNLYSKLNVYVSIIDLEGHVYSNWELDYNDYSFLMEEEWIKQSMKSQGHIVWELFSPSYIKNKENSNYISLARSFFGKGGQADVLGTLIISIEQRALSKVLSGFFYTNKDSVYILTSRDNEILLKDYKDTQIDDQHILNAAINVGSLKKGGFLDTYQKQKYLVSYYTLNSPWKYNGQALKIIHYTDYESISDKLQEFSRRQNIAVVMFIAVLVVVTGVISSQMVKPVRVLSAAMKDSVGTDIKLPLDLKRKDEIGHLNRTFTQMHKRNKELLEEVEYEYIVREKYQFESLRAQINPHFMFNTLNMIRWMAFMRGAENIVESIDALATMLRFNMKRSGELVTLEEELENIRSYVFIQNSRYADRYKVKIQVEEELLPLKIIKFILQPIVENAVLHAFNDEEGTIWVYADRRDETLKIYVEDNGTGVNSDTLDMLNKESASADILTGIGFKNVNERIRVEYGDEYGIFMENMPNKGSLVTFTLPVIENEGYNEKNNDC